jgi:hypothetical protein
VNCEIAPSMGRPGRYLPISIGRSFVTSRRAFLVFFSSLLLRVDGGGCKTVLREVDCSERNKSGSVVNLSALLQLDSALCLILKAMVLCLCIMDTVFIHLLSLR